MNWFKVHEDYDKISEPYRFLIALLFMSPFYIGLAIINKYFLAGLVGILFVCLVTIHRIYYIAKRTK